MFLGVNGIAVKSHGGTDALGYANAIGFAVDMMTQGFNEKVTSDLASLAKRATGLPRPPRSECRSTQPNRWLWLLSAGALPDQCRVGRTALRRPMNGLSRAPASGSAISPPMASSRLIWRQRRRKRR